MACDLDAQIESALPATCLWLGAPASHEPLQPEIDEKMLINLIFWTLGLSCFWTMAANTADATLNFAAFGSTEEMELTQRGVDAFNREGYTQIHLRRYSLAEYFALEKEWKSGKKPLPDLLYVTSSFMADAGPALFYDLRHCHKITITILAAL